jgi:hypothetical protein
LTILKKNTSKTPMKTEILAQRAAPSLNVETSIIALSLEHARELFRKATHRLLNISEWHTLPCSLLTALKLTDDNGLDVLDRQARENDYFVVNPDSGAREWVRVEKVCLQKDPSGSREVVTLRARPSGQPCSDDAELARMSNTFEITRDGLNVTVSVYGQNEEDQRKQLFRNETDEARPDSTVGAIHGVARVQWRSLVNGILSTWRE